MSIEKEKKEKKAKKLTEKEKQKREAKNARVSKTLREKKKPDKKKALVKKAKKIAKDTGKKVKQAKKAVKSAGKAAKKAVKSVGKTVARTVLGPASAVAAGGSAAHKGMQNKRYMAKGQSPARGRFPSLSLGKSKQSKKDDKGKPVAHTAFPALAKKRKEKVKEKVKEKAKEQVKEKAKEPSKNKLKIGGAAKTAASKSPVYKRAETAAERKDFRRAFAKARKSGAKIFEWQGRKYNTRLKKSA